MVFQNVIVFPYKHIALPWYHHLHGRGMSLLFTCFFGIQNMCITYLQSVCSWING